MHEIGTANFVLGGAPGMWKRGGASSSWHVASAEGSSSNVASKDVDTCWHFSSEEGGPDPHEFGTANFMFCGGQRRERAARGCS